MARNRMIQKTFWDDEKISQISKSARLVFIALWNLSDDYGVVKGHHVWLKNRIFPYDNDTMEDFNTWIFELRDFNFIIPFDANNREQYYFIKHFSVHQTINKPSEKRNPEPPDDILKEWSSNTEPLPSEVKLSKVEEEVKKKDELFKLPSKEDISESSILKLKDDLDKITKELYDKKIFLSVHSFKNKMLKEGKNERAIIHTLTRCYLKKEFVNDDPWAYCTKIISVEDGNYNEKDHRKATEGSV